MDSVVGGFGGGGTPGPIPNPEAKPSSADGTALVRVWESRSPPTSNVEKCPAGPRRGTFCCSGPLVSTVPRTRYRRFGARVASRWRELSTSRLPASTDRSTSIVGASLRWSTLDRARTASKSEESAMYETQVTVVGGSSPTSTGSRLNDGTVVANFRVAQHGAPVRSGRADWVDGDRLFVDVRCWRELARERARLPREGRSGGRHRQALHPQLRARGPATDGTDGRGAERRCGPDPLHGVLARAPSADADAAGSCTAMSARPRGERETPRATCTDDGRTSDGETCPLVRRRTGRRGLRRPQLPSLTWRSSSTPCRRSGRPTVTRSSSMT